MASSQPISMASSRALLLVLPSLLLAHCAHHPPSVHFYLHDTLFDNKSTSVIVAPPGAGPRTLATGLRFGDVVIFDNPITVGPSVMSKQVGTAQGIYAYTGRTNMSALWTFTAFLDTDDYTGSLTVTGVESVLGKNRELAMVFGTGDFLMARGIASMTTGKVVSDVYFTVLFNITLFY